MRTLRVLFATLALAASGDSIAAQTSAEMAALEARLTARLERRIAEETAEMSGHLEAQKIAFQQAIDTLAKSQNELDRKALAAIDSGATSAGLDVLEERARARDESVLAVSAAASANDLKTRADEWKRIAALAYLDNTQRSIDAYERALNFSPHDVQILDQLANLYLREGRASERAAIAQQMLSLDSPEAQARGYIHRGDGYLEASAPKQARLALEQGLALAKSADLPQLQAKALAYLGAADILDSRFAQGDQKASQAAELARANGFPYEEAEALYVLAVSAERKVSVTLIGRKKALEEADKRYARAQQAFLSMNDKLSAASVLVRRARVSAALGNHAQAETQVRDAISTMEAVGATGQLGYAEQQLAYALANQERFDEADRYYESSVRRARETKQVGYETVALMQWAQAKAAQSNEAEACRLATQAYDLVVAGGVTEVAQQRKNAEQIKKQLCR